MSLLTFCILTKFRSYIILQYSCVLNVMLQSSSHFSFSVFRKDVRTRIPLLVLVLIDIIAPSCPTLKVETACEIR
jgi:hypothetical protein